MAEVAKGNETKVLDRARARFKTAVEAEDENRKKELDDIKFLAASPDDHWQWPDDVYKLRTMPGQEGGARPCLTINKLPQHHRQVTNEQKMNRPQIKVQPVDDQGDVEVADIQNGMIRHIQVSSEADLAFDMAGDAQVAHGVGYFRVLTEYCDERSFDQDIVIAPIADRFKVYMDPLGLIQHPAGKKCRWGFIIEDLPKEEYESLYGDDHPIDWNEAGTGDMGDWFPNKETVRIAEYFEIEEQKKTLLLWEVGDGFATSIEGEKMPPGVPMGALPAKKRETRIPRCKWRKMTGQAVISEKEMPTKYIPICRMVGNQWIVEGKAIVSGLVRNAKDACRMYNYNASMEVELNALAPRAPFVAMAEQIAGHEDQWRKANTVNYAVLKYNAVIDPTTGQIVALQAPQRAQPAMPQAAVITAKLAAGDDIKATTGQYDPSLGQKSNETSGKAINARKVQSEVGTFHYIDNYARALRYAGTIILDMIPRVYDTKRIARIIGEDGEPDHVEIDPSIEGPYQEVTDEVTKKIKKIYNLGVGKYDVVVSVGPSFATQRQEAAQMLVELSQGATDPVMGAVMRYLTVKNMDWSGAKELSDILKKLLPPGVIENDDDENAEPVIQTPQGPLPASQAGELIAKLIGQLQQAGEAVKAAGDGAKMVEEAKRVMADASAKAEALKAREQIIAKTLEAEAAKDETVRTKIVSELKLMVERAVAGLERMKQADVQVKEGEDSGVAQKRQADADARNAAIAQQQAELMAALQAAIELMAAPRKIDLVTDEGGRPVGAVSAPVV